MIVKYNGLHYIFESENGERSIFTDKEMRRLLSGNEYQGGKNHGTIKLIRSNICFPDLLKAVPLIDLYRVAHAELKPLVFEKLYMEMQYTINTLTSKVQQLERKAYA